MSRYYDDYWKKNVMEWESTIYDNSNKEIGLTERIAGLFRKDIMIDRRDSAVRYLAGRIEGRTIADIGCAGGHLCEKLLKAGAKKVVGIDISPSAIESAKNRFASLNIPPEKYAFFAKNVNDPDFFIPECDLVVSLGVVLYLQGQEIGQFFSKLENHRIFIDYWEKAQWWDPTAICYYMYRKIKGYPFISSFKRDGLEEMLKKHGFSKIEFYNSRRNKFVFASA